MSLKILLDLRRTTDPVRRVKLRSIGRGFGAVFVGAWGLGLAALVPSCGLNWLSVFAVVAVLIPVVEIWIFRFRYGVDGSAYLDNRG
jgi:hypothetical protein